MICQERNNPQMTQMNTEKGQSKTGLYMDGQDRQDKNRTTKRAFGFIPAQPVYPRTKMNDICPNWVFSVSLCDISG